MKTIEQILAIYSDTTAEQWSQHPNGGGWVHSSAKLVAKVYFGSEAIARGGDIWGGVIRGGVITGGVIWGGVIWGGVIRGGVIRGGVITGGVIWGGVIWGGVIWGGVIRGGVIRGGEIWGGEWQTSPLFIVGSRHTLTHTKPGHIAIGCNVHTIDVWQKRYKAIGKANGYTTLEVEEYGMYIELFAARDRAIFGETKTTELTNETAERP